MIGPGGFGTLDELSVLKPAGYLGFTLRYGDTLALGPIMSASATSCIRAS